MLNKWLQVLYAPDGDGGGGTLMTGEQPEGEGTQNQPNNTSEPANNPDEGKGKPAGWLAGAPEEYRDHEMVKDCTKLGDFMSKAAEMHDKLNRAIVKPKDDASPEEVAAYRKELGIPEKAEDYKIPESGNKEYDEQFKKLAYETGLSNDQAKGIYDSISKQINDAAQNIKQMNEQTRQQGVDQLKKEHGDKYEEHLGNAKAALKHFTTPEFYKFLDETGLGDSPEMVNTFARVRAVISDDAMIKGSGSPGQTKDEYSLRFPNSPKPG